MGIGEIIFERLLAQREAKRQYQFDFMPPVRNSGPYAVTLDTSDTTLHVIAADFGRHGLMFESARLIAGNDALVENKPGGLVRLVERIVADFECPYGPIKCIENDERLTSALLRTEPTSDGCYFEIIVDGGSLADLRHYQIGDFDRGRRQTPVNLGRRVFAIMIDALADVFDATEPVA